MEEWEEEGEQKRRRGGERRRRRVEAEKEEMMRGDGENKRKIREKSADNKYTVILRGTSRIEFRTGTSDKPRILGTRNNKVEGNTDSEAGLVGKNSSNEAHRMFLPF
jgi:hypothetical protein